MLICSPKGWFIINNNVVEFLPDWLLLGEKKAKHILCGYVER